MTEFQHNPAVSKDKSALGSAIVRASEMFKAVCGPRNWNDTRESWMARGAARCRLTLRRARAIVYQEPIRLTADEYVAIQTAFDEFNCRLAMADAAMAAISDLARPPASQAGGSAPGPGREAAEPRREADRQAYPVAQRPAR